MSSKKTSELSVATSLSLTDRLVALVNPAGNPDTKTITVDNLVKSFTRQLSVVSNTSFAANSSHDVLICQPTSNTIVTFPTSVANGKSYTVKYANGTGTLTVQSNTAGRLENPSNGTLGNTFILTTGQSYTWISSNGYYWSI